jgi:UDP-N-acetylglucosamine--N-acetylmuramyl-(pentapeptide) pyrophosphoryl-undecaprenol N-acetylglucosamine transferase
MRVALAAGGTGGHIFPALSVAKALQARDPGIDLRFFGPTNRGEAALVEPSGIPFEAVGAAPLRDRGPLSFGRGAWRIAAGVVTAVRKLRRYRPDVVFSTGGYGSFPQSVAARILRKPLVVFLPDVAPGWAVRAETRLATRMATTAEAALEYLPRQKTTVTRYPVRPEFFTLTREQARRQLGLRPEERVLLIAGASQGAHAINRAVFEQAEDLAKDTFVVHITGTADYEQASALAARIPDYVACAFRDDLPAIMRAADLAVMRAGASVLGELPAAALPAILVPGTFAGAHQRDNARWLAECGAAVVLEETELGRLAETVRSILDHEDRRSAMAAAAAAIARPGAAAAIAAIIEEVAAR